MKIRDETKEDIAQIRALTDAAFALTSYSDGTEGEIIDALRAAGALSPSLVADEDGVIGHVAFSKVLVDGRDPNWYGLGPVAVTPGQQGRGVGRALIREGLSRLRKRGAGGVVVLGDPAFYGRFGFESAPSMYFGDAPSPYFQRLVLSGAEPSGQVQYHTAFGAS